jgi:alkanesulfonate monooxygenase SsuD/methylene tetrahydromethanopterin reductase-like flavin-dependent oxidoreductase (luciferase family)
VDYSQPVRFGVFVTPEATERPLQNATLADALGFDLVGIQDHPYQRRFFDTWTLLTAIAMRTERITVFPDVANLPLRPPSMLAKAAATLDILSGGRLELGLGAGGFWDGIRAYDGQVRTPGGIGVSARGGDPGHPALVERAARHTFRGRALQARRRAFGTSPDTPDRHLARRVQAADAVARRPPCGWLGTVAWRRAAS